MLMHLERINIVIVTIGWDMVNLVGICMYAFVHLNTYVVQDHVC